MLKYTIPSLIQILIPWYTWKVKTKDKLVFLTFDDGPHPEITPWVLHELGKFEALATFFCVGENVKKYPEVYEKIIGAGHSTGNHTFHHLNGFKTKTKAYIKNIDLAANYIKSNLFRPPYGRIGLRQTLLLRDYKIIMWNRLSCDFEKYLNIEESLSAMKNIENGSILVFHDSEKAFNNLQLLLPKLLDFYHQNGFKMVALNPN